MFEVLQQHLVIALLKAEFLDEKRLKRDGDHDVEMAPHATTNNRCVVCREKYLRAKHGETMGQRLRTYQNVVRQFTDARNCRILVHRKARQ